MEANYLREYIFHVQGFIPGIPGTFPAGSQVIVDERTNEVVDILPHPPALENEASTKTEEQPGKPGQEQPETPQEQQSSPGQGDALSVEEQSAPTPVLDLGLGGNN